MDRLIEIRARCEAAKEEKRKGNDLDCACLSWAVVLNDVPHMMAEIERLHGLLAERNVLLDKYEAENRWIPVGERLPKSDEHVLLCCEIRPAGKRYVCDGYYAAPKSIVCNNPEGAIDYDEETDEYYLLEGWYEVIENWEDFSSVCIDDFVTHWRPLPELPKGE